MELCRLSGRKICERVKVKGSQWKGKHLHARFIIGAPRHPDAVETNCLYVGTVTSAKLDPSAVRRNRMRRRSREALRLTLRAKKEDTKQQNIQSSLSVPQQLPSIQLLLLPRSSSLHASFGELVADSESLLSSLISRAIHTR